MFTSIKRYLALGLVAAGLGLSSQASASPILTGDSVHIQFTDFTFFNAETDAVVGPGIEYAPYVYTIDVGDNYVTINLFGGGYCGTTCTGTPSYLIVSGMDFLPASAVTGVSLTDGGLGAFNPSFTANSVQFQMADQPIQGGQFATLNFTVGDATAVPEPASLALLGTGLLGFAARRRRAKRQAA